MPLPYDDGRVLVPSSEQELTHFDPASHVADLHADMRTESQTKRGTSSGDPETAVRERSQIFL